MNRRITKLPTEGSGKDPSPEPPEPLGCCHMQPVARLSNNVGSRNSKQSGDSNQQQQQQDKRNNNNKNNNDSNKNNEEE